LAKVYFLFHFPLAFSSWENVKAKRSLLTSPERKDGVKKSGQNKARKGEEKL